MAFCSKCGAETQDKFCAACGEPVSETSAKEVTPTQPTADASKDAQDNKVMAILSYIIFFIPLLTGDHKKSPFVKFHANQGTVLFLASLVLMIAWNIVAAVLMITIVLIPVVLLISGLIWLVPTVFAILGIINVCKEKMIPLPIIGKWQIIK